jgi:hypothetical protein
MRRSDSDDDPFGWNSCWGFDPDLDSQEDFNPTRHQISDTAPQQLQLPLTPILVNLEKHQLKMERKTTKTGEGIEAARSAVFQSYDAASSKVVSEWKKQLEGTTITKPLLMTLIKSILDFFPEDQRPTPPTRNMKRTKHGLIFWLDVNQTAALHYFNRAH